MRKTVALLSSKGFTMKNSITIDLSQKFPRHLPLLPLPKHINYAMYLYLIKVSVQSLKLS